MAYPQHVLTVAGLVTNASGDVLLIESPRRGWEFPGGQVENGESLTDALVREIREETGVTAEVKDLVGIYSNVGTYMLHMNFLCDYVDGDLLTSAESLRVEWVPRDYVLSRITHEGIRDRMRDMLNYHGQVMYRVYTNRPYEIISEAWMTHQQSLE